MVGVPKLRIPVLAGQEVKVRYAEALHKGGFYTDNYRSAQSINLYRLDRRCASLCDAVNVYGRYIWLLGGLAAKRAGRARSRWQNPSIYSICGMD